MRAHTCEDLVSDSNEAMCFDKDRGVRSSTDSSDCTIRSKAKGRMTARSICRLFEGMCLFGVSILTLPAGYGIRHKNCSIRCWSLKCKRISCVMPRLKCRVEEIGKLNKRAQPSKTGTANLAVSGLQPCCTAAMSASLQKYSPPRGAL